MESNVNFDELMPALVSCFGIILMGYLSGRMNLISESELKGMNTFVQVFVLPSLIFVNMVQMNLGSVNWYFLLGILIAKSVIFIGVVAIYVMIFGMRGLATGGLIAIFCTQSNDFALGYPIVEALYSKTHPGFVQYMYLLAPINLAILNPIAFFMMETKTLSEQMELIKNAYKIQNAYWRRLVYTANILKKIYTNPIIFMTVLGLVANYIFKQHLPLYFSCILNTMGQAFSACALFSLGMRMLGKIKTLSGAKLITPCLLVLTKLLALPLLAREIINILDVGDSQSDSLDWSTFGFLYGTIPSAPTVFVFAVAYNLEVDLVATTMVACTFVSGPWMFVSAKMIALTSVAPAEYMQQLCYFIADVSIASLCASVWVLLVFVLTKRVHKVPHKFVACLTASQILSCVGAVLHRFIDLGEGRSILGNVQFFLFTSGIYAGRLWTAIIAITLLFLESRSLCFIVYKLQPAFYAIGWLLPAALSVLLMIFDEKKDVPDAERNPNFVYGTFQAVIAVFLLVLCFIVSAGCLVMFEIHKRQRQAPATPALHDEHVESEDVEDDEASLIGPNTAATAAVADCGLSNCCNSAMCTQTAGAGVQRRMSTIPENGVSAVNQHRPEVIDIEDLFAEHRKAPPTPTECPSGLVCEPREPTPNTMSCQGVLMQYRNPIDDELDLSEEDAADHDPQIFRHFILIIIMLSSMLVGLAVAVWTLVMEQMSGIYVELSFLDASLNFGQSIVVLVLFGIDNKYVLVPLQRKLRQVWYRNEKLVLPMAEELSAATQHVCEQFRKHHQTNCARDIACKRTYHLKEYDNVFSGRLLVDWLLDVGLATDRATAVNYARHLIEGRVLRHIKEVYHFYDRNLLYTFA